MNIQSKSPVERFAKASSRWLTLLLAPLTISLSTIILTNLATEASVPTWLIIFNSFSAIASILFYLVAYTRVLNKALRRISRRFRSRMYQSPYVLIRDGTIEGDSREIPATPLHTDRSPIDWRTPLAELGWNVELGPLSTINSNHPPEIVINPFGEVYPEADFLSSASASSIRQYVWSGGVYVNIAGIPFWYRYDTKTGKRETAGRVEGIFEGQAKWISLLHDTFPNLEPSSEPEVVDCYQLVEEVKRFGSIANAGGNNNVGMFRANPLKPPRLLTMLRDAKDKYCIIGAYQFGEGAFLFASLVIDRSNLSFEKAVAAIKGWAKYESNNRTP